MRRIIYDSVVPIILGNEKLAYKIAASLFFRYGLVSNIFAESRSFASHFAFFTLYHTLPSSKNDCFVLMSLDRFYTERGESTYLLIPTNEEYAALIKRNLENLERKFIIRDSDDVVGKRDVFPLVAQKKGL